jgi:hypothetical protein
LIGRKKYLRKAALLWMIQHLPLIIKNQYVFLLLTRTRHPSPNQSAQELLLDFTELFGGLVTLSLVDASTSYVTPTDAFFTGFYNMVYVGKNRVRGLSGTVANNPEWCSNGCFELAELDLATGNSKVLNLIPFKVSVSRSGLETYRSDRP